MYSEEPFPLHYAALGVPETATFDVIRAAWREIARSSHPDHAGADAGLRERFRAASDAWSALRDPESRAIYDAELVQIRMPRCIQCGRPSSVPVCTLCALSGLPPQRPRRGRPRPGRHRPRPGRHRPHLPHPLRSRRSPRPRVRAGRPRSRMR